jgi:hypothetical protein
MKTGQKVSWNSSGGTARGIIREIVRDGKVSGIPVKVTGTKDEPAARIEIIDDEGKPTGTMVGHKLSTLRKAQYDNEVFNTETLAKAEYQGETVTLNKPRRIKGGNKKFEVFVQDGDKVKRVAFGDPNMEIRRDDPKARANFRSRHSCDTKKDKTTAGYWSCRMWESNTSVGEMTKNIEGKILKTDDEQRMVYGWASVVTEKGEAVIDRQGDVIEAGTLVKAVNEFMEHVRVGKAMHVGDQVGVVVHSLPITKEIGDALGIQSDREGWVVAYKVFDDTVWDMVKSGELAAFSIGGRAIKEEI